MTQYVTEMNAQGHYIGPYLNLKWNVYKFNTGVIIFCDESKGGISNLKLMNLFIHNPRSAQFSLEKKLELSAFWACALNGYT